MLLSLTHRKTSHSGESGKTGYIFFPGEKYYLLNDVEYMRSLSLENERDGSA